MKATFFVPCTIQEEEDVSRMIEHLGYKRWRSKCARSWYTGDNGLLATKEGIYMVSENCRNRYLVVSVDKLKRILSYLNHELNNNTLNP